MILFFCILSHTVYSQKEVMLKINNKKEPLVMNLNNSKRKTKIEVKDLLETLIFDCIQKQHR